MYQEEILNYYSDAKLQKAILEAGQDREVVPVISTGSFGTRPNAVFYEKDIGQMVKDGAISFHGSVERWKNPLSLRKEMKKADFNKLRIGWDLIIDIDCDAGLDYSKTAALEILKVMKERGVKNRTVKFSGNRGFHIAVPFEAFPESIGYKPTKDRYPELPKILIEYINYLIKPRLKDKFGRDPSEIITLDSGLISPRHLIRMPYCLHRKTWLVSLPILGKDIAGFKKEDAEASKISVKNRFLTRKTEENEAVELLQDAISWHSSTVAKKTKKYEGPEIEIPQKAIPPEYFPPCINKTLAGLEDGRKRSIFVLTTYLHHIGWPREEIEKMLLAWNQKNKEPLSENLIKATIRSQYTRKAPQMSPNCNHAAFYKEYGVCVPDAFCKTINNPVTYTLHKVRNSRKRRRTKRVKKHGSTNV
jgi:hypothetical protein